MEVHTVQASLLTSKQQHLNSVVIAGCHLDSTLCLESEKCIDDGLFGHCYAPTTRIDGDTFVPLVLDAELTGAQRALLRSQLEGLATQNLDWRDARSQCVLAYYKLTIAYGLNYDAEFCDVRNPANIVNLIQASLLYQAVNSQHSLKSQSDC